MHQCSCGAPGGDLGREGLVVVDLPYAGPTLSPFEALSDGTR
jgi:hypothetical protein